MKLPPPELGWLVFVFGSLVFALFILKWVRAFTTNTPGAWFVDSCICGRSKDLLRIRKNSYGSGTGFCLLWMEVAVLPAIFTGVHSSLDQTYIWKLVIIALNLPIGLIAMASYANNDHNSACSIRKGLLGACLLIFPVKSDSL